MNKAILCECLRLARKKLPHHPDIECYKHFSFLIKDNKIISHGMNHKGIPSPKWGYHSSKLSEGFRPKTHSELNAIFRCREYFRGATMVNVRLARNGEIRMSMPCKTCRNVLKVVGINKCWFTTENNWGYLAI